MTRFDPYFQRALDALNAKGLRRTLRPVGHRRMDPKVVRRDGARLIDCASNDYLGLASHPALAERAAQWAELYGTGGRASRLVTGTLDLHASVENRLARFKKVESALIFASGWQANASVLPALFALSGKQTGHDALVFTDRLNHASMHHGCVASGVRQHRFRHNDMAHLESLLAKHAHEKGLRFIVTESVFSMDGDRADVAALRLLADRHEAFLYIDEAHATGVLGSHGQGLATDHGVDLVMGTFSKALGAMGAYVAGSRAVCDYLVSACSGFIYSTAPSPPMLGAIDAALEVVPGLTAERARLEASGQTLRKALAAAGLDSCGSTTQIVPVRIGDAARAMDVAHRLASDGILAVAIRPPTVPAGTARLRLTLNAMQDEKDITTIANAVIQAMHETAP
ncbi:aminotransferase class I/II-fold pyridoxal phosphate-dependent enzyme [Brytella acorum]|uniref:8-amino-7-oxononanoate synthase n=1 Tax=Brytella acorum TaxID=2959299 RepID=A0AA35Y3L1_9PROT|nr:8-amino-7-oxononanoate synthase [Brytella acorum]MDF3625444.1 8-amino-7-oxononanoate synthase [Brytella acorum]CAI9120295.1 8-amino-7-oxononanoate synthase [Brytella acorum]